MSFLVNSFVYSAAPAPSYLVDTYSPEVAYSLRKLSSTATNAIRVRRSNDNAETDIGFSGDELDTASLLSFVGANNGFVTTWYDQSGNNKNSTMATAGSQPLIISSGSLNQVNSKAAILGDGIDDTLRYSGLSLTNPITIFTVVDKVGTSGIFGLFSPAFGLAGAFLLVTNGYQAYQNGPSFSPIFGNNNQNLLTFKTSTIGTDWDLYGNGSQVLNSGENIGTEIGTVISLFDRPNIGIRANMHMQEFIIFPTDESANRTSIELNINDYYGIYP